MSEKNVNPRIATTIIEEYKAGKKTLEEANQALKEIGSGFHLDPSKATDGWTEAEMKEGFIRNDDHVEILPERPDMKRRTDLAGQVVQQRTKHGKFNVTYDEDGYAVKASKV